MISFTTKRRGAFGLCRLLAQSGLVGVLFWATASAQTRWVVDAPSSLAWWQMDPNLNHLWGTTCPGDPSWRPGDGGRSSGWSMNARDRSPGFANLSDTVHMPLYPRHRVRHVCVEAVRGEVVADTAKWQQVHGTFAVRGEALISGEAMRDVMMHQVLEVGRYPEIVFTLDSLTNIARLGDTLTGTGVGTLKVRDQLRPTMATIKAFPESGNVRVLAHWHIPAQDLDNLTPSLSRFSLGLGTHIWKMFFMGADLVLRPSDRPAL